MVGHGEHAGLGRDGKEQIPQATVCCTNSTWSQAGEKEATLKRLILSWWTREGDEVWGGSVGGWAAHFPKSGVEGSETT